LFKNSNNAIIHLPKVSLTILFGRLRGSVMAKYDICPMCGRQKTAVSKTCMKCRTVRTASKEYFWSKIDKRGPDDCWEWQASRSRKGYGIAPLGHKSRSAHRVAWEITYGPIPDGLHVLHTCDNPACCNCAHLFLGTNADNVADRVHKGRGHKGQNHTRAKFTENQIRAIRVFAKNNKINQSEIAKQYGVNNATISRIVNRGRWGWLQD
jgi:hypothetical protein